MSHLFSLLSLSLEGVCTFRKPFSDIGPVGRMTTKRDGGKGLPGNKGWYRSSEALKGWPLSLTSPLGSASFRL